jgi:hypothetical protein
MKNTNQIDLRTQGGVRTVNVTPGNSVQFVFDSQQSRIGASGTKSGLYNYVTGIWLSCIMTVVRSSGGTTIVYPDAFPRALSSIGLTTPMFGTMLDPTVVNGMTAKHILEFFGMGYRRAGVNRAPIPGTDATYDRCFEIFIPFRQGWNPWADHFDFWLGWLDESILEIFVESSATPFGLSGVTITDVDISASIETVPFSEIVIPSYTVLRRYEQAAAAGSNGPKLTNVGDAGALQGCDDGSRLCDMLFSHQAGGFIGSGTADQIDAITMPWRDQAQSTFPEFFFARFLETAQWPQRGTAAALDNSDIMEPYLMPVGPAAATALNDATARYTPLVWVERNELISTLQKVKGNYPLDGMIFGTTQTGSFRVYTRELKQFSISKCSEMLAAIGVDPSRVQLVPKLGRKNKKPVAADKMFCMPRGVVTKAA